MGSLDIPKKRGLTIVYAEGLEKKSLDELYNLIASLKSKPFVEEEMAPFIMPVLEDIKRDEQRYAEYTDKNGKKHHKFKLHSKFTEVQQLNDVLYVLFESDVVGKTFIIDKMYLTIINQKIYLAILFSDDKPYIIIETPQLKEQATISLISGTFQSKLNVMFKKVVIPSNKFPEIQSTVNGIKVSSTHKVNTDPNLREITVTAFEEVGGLDNSPRYKNDFSKAGPSKKLKITGKRIIIPSYKKEKYKFTVYETGHVTIISYLTLQQAVELIRYAVVPYVKVTNSTLK